MFVLLRAITFATLFIALLLVFVPARILAGSGVTQPAAIGLLQAAGILMTAAGAALAVWCILSFALLGKGTPAPFDATFGSEYERYCKDVRRWSPRF